MSDGATTEHNQEEGPWQVVFDAQRSYTDLTSTLGQKLSCARAGDPQALGGAAPGLLRGRHGDTSQELSVRPKPGVSSNRGCPASEVHSSGQPPTHSTTHR